MWKPLIEQQKDLGFIRSIIFTSRSKWFNLKNEYMSLLQFNLRVIKIGIHEATGYSMIIKLL